MAAIRQIDIRTFVGGQAEQLGIVERPGGGARRLKDTAETKPSAVQFAQRQRIGDGGSAFQRLVRRRAHRQSA